MFWRELEVVRVGFSVRRLGTDLIREKEEGWKGGNGSQHGAGELSDPWEGTRGRSASPEVGKVQWDGMEFPGKPWLPLGLWKCPVGQTLEKSGIVQGKVGWGLGNLG